MIIKDIEQLKKMTVTDKAPFEIAFPHGILYCEKIFRVVPGKRLVALARWHEKQVVVKLFYSHSAERYVTRALRGSELLAKAHVPMPDILYSGLAHIVDVWMLLFEYLPATTDADEIWYGDDIARLRQLVFSMQEILAAQHRSGCYHVDLHPNNFLIQDDRLYVLDFDAVKSIGLFKNRALISLASLYAQLCLKHQKLVPEFFRHYCYLRRWPYDQALIEKWLHRVQYNRMREIQTHYLRSGTHVIAEKTFRKQTFCARDKYSEKMKKFLENPNEHMKNGVSIKRGNSCTLVKITVDGEPLVVKRYNIKNIFHFLKKGFRTSRAIKSWGNSHLLQVIGVDTPMPVAAIENRFGPVRLVSYFVSEYVEGENLKDFFDRKRAPDDESKQVVSKIVTWLKQLHAALITHGDLKATNFILKELSPVIVDLDAMRVHKYAHLFKRWRDKDVRRLLKNWSDRPYIKAMFEAQLTPAHEVRADQHDAEIDVSVIIVNYNTSHCLAYSVQSVLKQKECRYEILVVDNASSDGSREFIKTFGDKVIPIFNDENVGFGKANNQAFVKSHGRYIFLLNPDAELSGEKDLRKLIDFMRADSQIGLASGQIVSPDENVETRPRAYYPGEKRLGFPYKYLSGEIAWVLGACMMLPREVYDKLHGFDEDYFLYGEDVDLCLRVRKMGLTIGYCQEVSVKHIGGESEKKTDCYDRIFRKQKGLHLFYKKHYGQKDARYLVKRELFRARFRKIYQRFCVFLWSDDRARCKYDRYRAICDCAQQFLEEKDE